MNSKQISLIAIFLWIALVLVVGYRFVTGSAKKADDGRSVVTISPSEKVMILGEMRTLLQAVQGIVAAIEHNDMKGVETAALGAGTAMMVDDSPGLMMKLPLAFKTQGIGAHKYFDTIAAEAKKGASRDKIISMLNTQLQGCIGCHAGYQFKTE